MKDTLSVKMFKTLKRAKKRLTPQSLSQMVEYVNSQRIDSVCFTNRSGCADPYYTLFGWLLCHLLDIRLDHHKMKALLEKEDTTKMDLVAYAVHERCHLLMEITSQQGKFRWFSRRFVPSFRSLNIKDRPAPHGDPDAPYSLFIRMMLQEDMGRGIVDLKQSVARMQAYHKEGGGYSNQMDASLPSVNATAAALSVLGQLNGYKTNDDVKALKKMQQPNGGFPASRDALMPDLLSTATALFTLHCYNESPLYAPSSFIEAHWLDSGGFAATLAEHKGDVEYMFYGLLALGAS